MKKIIIKDEEFDSITLPQRKNSEASPKVAVRFKNEASEIELPKARNNIKDNSKKDTLPDKKTSKKNPKTSSTNVQKKLRNNEEAKKIETSRNTTRTTVIHNPESTKAQKKNREFPTSSIFLGEPTPEKIEAKKIQSNEAVASELNELTDSLLRRSETFEKEKTELADEVSSNTEKLSKSDVIKIQEIMATQEPTIKTKKPKKKLYLRKEILYILMGIFVITASLSVYKIFNWSKENKETKEIIEMINEQVVINEVQPDPEASVQVNPPEDKTDPYYEFIKTPLLNVDFTELKKLNSDTHGWLKVNGTQINLPFVKAKDNEYYLWRSFDKKSNEAGWIFLDYKNDLNSPSKNNVIYGHNRTNKTMFGTLENILTKEWYTNPDNYTIRISTPTHNMIWQVFSVYYVKTEDYYITTDFGDDDEFNTFLETIKSRSIYDFGTSVDVNDKVLTLSTCKDFNVNRTVLHAKLILTEKR